MKKQFTGISLQGSEEERISMSPINLHERSTLTTKDENMPGMRETSIPENRPLIPDPCFSINCCACITIFIVLLIILSPLSCQADIFIKDLPDGSLQFSNCPIDSGWKTYIREKNHPPRQPNHITMGELDRAISDIAPVYNIDPSLIKSIIEVESEFSPNAMSQKGAIGLMQIMPDTAFEMGIDDPWNPTQNITAGTKYLSILLKKYNGNLPLALAAYNAGPTMVQAYNGIPPFQETIDYVKKVLKSIGK
ncbi:MAG: lytic transglycosylase domain-containing protein [Thermodesulfobacteriota bacterium]|nr:lytic transglycosylase domain-containing protein [Thermodesulfobacteriota bacterium]